MHSHRRHKPTAERSLFSRAVENVRRAFSEFLAIPTLIIIGFLFLSGGMYELDRLRIEQNWPQLLPVDHDSVRTFLSTIATSIITVTSITFSLLLVAVQQGATSLTAQVYDQFLRRRANQAYFGYFTGLALYCLVILALVHPNYTPVYGAVLAFLFTVAALYLLILLIYSTIDQMRPVMIVQSIRDHTLKAREHQQSLLNGSRRESTPSGSRGLPIAATDSGYISSIDLDVLEREARRCGAPEIRLLRSVGAYVSLGQNIAELQPAEAGYDPDTDAIRGAIKFTEQRDLDLDPAFGIEQLSTIAWTSASTSKSNPHPGTLACWNLRDLIASWYPEEEEGQEREGKCIVVYPDNVPTVLLRAFESLSVVTSESMQHQTLAEVYRALELGIRRMPAPLRSEIHGIILRSLSSLGDHVLTAELSESIDELAEAMEEVGMNTEALATARGTLARSIGHLAARSNRSTPDKLS